MRDSRIWYRLVGSSAAGSWHFSQPMVSTGASRLARMVTIFACCCFHCGCGAAQDDDVCEEEEDAPAAAELEDGLVSAVADADDIDADEEEEDAAAAAAAEDELLLLPFSLDLLTAAPSEAKYAEVVSLAAAAVRLRTRGGEEGDSAPLLLASALEFAALSTTTAAAAVAAICIAELLLVLLLLAIAAAAPALRGPSRKVGTLRPGDTLADSAAMLNDACDGTALFGDALAAADDASAAALFIISTALLAMLVAAPLLEPIVAQALDVAS